MSTRRERTVGYLLWCYPRAWRSRYGQELEALIVDMSGEGPVPWRVRLNVAGAAARERLVSAFGSRQQKPEARMLSGILLVLWAWMLFVLGGSIVAKTAEHWSGAVAGGAPEVSTTAYGVLAVAAVAAGVLVLAGIGYGLPQFLAFLRSGGWPQIRRHVLIAGAVSLLAAGATVGLIMLAGWMDDGHHLASSLARAAFLGWAGLGAACLFCWTAAASTTARHLNLPTPTLRVEWWLATTLSLLMAVMTAATVLWWLTVAHVAPGALTGGSAGRQAPAIVPQLVVALVLMVLAAAVAAEGAWRASTARRAVLGG